MSVSTAFHLMFVHNVEVAERQPFGKDLLTIMTIVSLFILNSCNLNFEGEILVLIVPVLIPFVLNPWPR